MFPFPFSFLSGAVPDVPVTQIANAEAMSFNGTDAYVKGSASLPSSNYTITAWINIETLTTETIVSWGELDAGKRRSLFIWNGGTGAYKLYSSTYSSNIAGSTALAANQWYHAAVTVSSAGDAKIYLNGSLDGIGTNTLNSFTGTDFYIGGGTPGEYFDGKIDEVAIFNKVLSSKKIKQIHDATAVVGGVPQTANLFTGGLSSSLVYWNRMGDS